MLSESDAGGRLLKYVECTANAGAHISGRPRGAGAGTGGVLLRIFILKKPAESDSVSNRAKTEGAKEIDNDRTEENNNNNNKYNNYNIKNNNNLKTQDSKLADNDNGSAACGSAGRGFFFSRR